MRRFTFWLAGAFLLIVGFSIAAQSGALGTGWLWKWSDGGSLMPQLVVGAAVIDSINPCAFSILLVTIAFMFTLGKRRSSVLAMGGLYVAGIFTIYLLIGLGVLRVLHLFNTPHFMGLAGALALAVFGLLSVVGVYAPSFPLSPRIPARAHATIASLVDRASLPAAFGLGALVGVCEFPCTGGPYLLILGMLHDSATAVSGFAYLLLYNLIFVLPLVLVVLYASNAAVVAKLQSWRMDHSRPMRLYGGFAMLILGIIILTNLL